MSSKGLYLLPFLLCAGLASAAADELERHYDARAAVTRTVVPDQLRSRVTVPQSLSADVQELSAMDLDEVTGSVRSLSSERGFLSVAAPGKPMDIAMDFVKRNLAALNLQPS